MNVLVDRKKLDHKINTSHMIGSEGCCYVKENEIIKIYFKSKFFQNIHDLTIYESDLIAFPKHYLLDKEERYSVIGEVMEYFPKRAIYYSLNEDCNVKKFVDYYVDMFKEIAKYGEIEMNDLLGVNILYDENTGFNLIDTTRWKIDNDGGYIRTNQNNFTDEIIKELYSILDICEYTIFRTGLKDNLKKYGKDGTKLYKLICSSFYEPECFLEIMNLFEKLMQEKSGIELNTISDMVKYTKTLKRT